MQIWSFYPYLEPKTILNARWEFSLPSMGISSTKFAKFQNGIYISVGIFPRG